MLELCFYESLAAKNGSIAIKSKAIGSALKENQRSPAQNKWVESPPYSLEPIRYQERH